MVHGYAGSSFTWHRWRGPLARRGRVIQVDLKGFGRAPKPDDGRYATNDLVDLLVELVRQLDLTRLTLVGHSLGGGLSLLAALRFLDADEQRLARLALIAAPAYEQKLPPFVALSKTPRVSEGLARLVGPEIIVSQVLRSIVHDPGGVTEEQIRAYAQGLASEGGIRAAMDVGRSIVPDDLHRISARYPEVDIPTFLLWGDSDPVIPLWVGERLAREIPEASLTVLDACGHIPPEEHPEASLRAFETFLDAHPLA
jgi:pimeloyl-ACP methyl ester carboxylesterase